MQKARCPNLGSGHRCLRLFSRNQVIVDGLTAVQQIHICIGADIGKQVSSFLGVLFLHIRTVVDGDVFLAVVTDLLCQGLQQNLDVLAGAEELAASSFIRILQYLSICL